MSVLLLRCLSSGLHKPVSGLCVSLQFYTWSVFDWMQLHQIFSVIFVTDFYLHRPQIQPSGLILSSLTLLRVLLSTQSHSEVILKPTKGLRNCSAVQLFSSCGCSNSLGVAGRPTCAAMDLLAADHVLHYGLAANHAAASQRHGVGLVAQESCLPLS